MHPDVDDLIKDTFFLHTRLAHELILVVFAIDSFFAYTHKKTVEVPKIKITKRSITQTTKSHPDGKKRP